MDQKNILCFGDSNTHGYNSKTGGRFTVEERWTKLLQRKLGDDYYVIEEGLSGRTTSFEDPVFEGLSGLNAIYPCMMTHEPLDLVIIMLGTNDTKDRFNANGFIIGKGLFTDTKIIFLQVNVGAVIQKQFTSARNAIVNQQRL